MRIRELVLIFAGALAGLSACADLSVKHDEAIPEAHFDLLYDQFVLSANGKTPYDLSSLQSVPAECGATPQPPLGGGAAILATVTTDVMAKAATAIVSALKKWINAVVAEYSHEVIGRPTNVAFYSKELWFHKKDSNRYSCFILTVGKCAAADVDKTTGKCRKETADTRIMIVGQYRLTNDSLQIRPLFGQVKGFEARRNPDGEASLSVTLKFDSVWWDGHQGHVESPMTAKVLTLKFKPTADGPDDTGVDLPVQHKEPGGYAYADWNFEPFYPRPPQSPDSEGAITITTTIAESNQPPKDLEFVSKVLKDNSSDLSSALKSALQAIEPKK